MIFGSFIKEKKTAIRFKIVFKFEIIVKIVLMSKVHSILSSSYFPLI